MLASIGLHATVLSSQGKYVEAKAMHQQRLELMEKVLGVEHPSTLTSISNLAEALSDQGKLGQVRSGQGDASTDARANGEGARRRALKTLTSV